MPSTTQQSRQKISNPLSRLTNQGPSPMDYAIRIFCTLGIVVFAFGFYSMIKIVSAVPGRQSKTQKQQQQQDQQPMIRSNAIMNTNDSDATKHRTVTLTTRTTKYEPPPKLADNLKQILVLSTSLGDIRIELLPDLSEGSVNYIRRVVESKDCKRCNFYRAEKPGIFQGVMANKELGLNHKFGDCPSGAETIENKCPEHDKNCGCHGPVLEKGSVAWAGGTAGGPDFFIDNYERPAKFWGTQHTKFGHIFDETSFEIINKALNFPVKNNHGMHILEDTIPFTMSLETVEKEA